MERHCQDRGRQDAATIETMIPTRLVYTSDLGPGHIHKTIEQAEVGYAPYV